MGHDDHGRSAGRLLPDHLDQSLTRTRVEPARWFIQEDEPRLVNKGPREGDPLPLTARVRPHWTVGEGLELKALDGARQSALRVAPMQERRETDVLPSGQVWIAQ